MKAYSSELFETLVGLLKKAIDVNYEPLQEEVMNLLSASAQVIESEFSKYYNVLMPLMMQILDNIGTANMQQMTLRARTIETMGYMIAAVAEEKEAFKDSVHQIARSLVLVLSSVASDDPQGLAIKEAMSRIAYFLKEDFHAYFAQVLPSLLSDSQQKIDIKMTSADEAGGEGFTLKLKGFEGE